MEQERTSPPPLPQAFRRAVQGEYWDMGGSERVMQEGRDGEAQSWFGTIGFFLASESAGTSSIQGIHLHYQLIFVNLNVKECGPG